MREEDLWDMSDEELEAAYKEAQAEQASPEIDEDEQLDSPEPAEEADITEDEEVVVDDEEMSEDVETTDEDEDGLEQPEDALEDSDHDTSDEPDADEESEEDVEDKESQSDEDSEEPSSDDASEEDGEEQPAQSYTFKANGKEYEFTSQELIDQFPRIFGQAMDYTKKMQAIKPWRKTIDAIESAELAHEDVSLMIDVLKGDKEAITEVLKRTGVDALDLDSSAESNYVTKDYGRDDSALAIKDIVDDISRDAEYATTQNILSKEWDDRSWATISENPEMIRLLHADVRSGMFQTLQPIAEKLRVYDGGVKSDLDYYKAAAQQHFNQVAQQDAYEKRTAERQAQAEAAAAEKQRVAEVKAKSEQRKATQKASAKRKAAAPSKSAAQGRDVIDYLDESDEAFDEWYNKLQNDL